MNLACKIFDIYDQNVLISSTFCNDSITGGNIFNLTVKNHISQ